MGELTMNKKTICPLLSICLAAVCLSSCGSTEPKAADISASESMAAAASAEESKAETVAVNTDDFETVQVDVMRGEIYNTLDELIAHSTAVVIGEFTSDEGTEFTYSDPDAQKNMSWAVSKAGLRIEKVLSGELNEENIVLCENYGFKETDGKMKLYAFTELAPMNVGEKWIIFLSRSDEGSWWITGDANGRWPLPSQLGKTDASKFKNGRINENGFDEKLCKEIYERFKVE